MTISELQMGLIGAGTAAVVVVFAYSKWQETRHRRNAEKVFGGEQRDVLLEQPAGERVEPRAQPADGAAREAELVWGGTETNPRRLAPDQPPGVDARVDCLIRIESIEPLSAAKLWLAQREVLGAVDKPLAWYGFDDARNSWEELGGHSAGSYHWFGVAMQMADRRGAISDGEFQVFADGVQRLCDQFLAVPASVPIQGEALGRAVELDRFCASVDVQIGVNVVAVGNPFAGTKIRGLAEAHGLILREDGMFHAADEEGTTLFALANLEPVLFTTEGLRGLLTNGLTLMVDVPRVRDGLLAFDRMMAFARQLADALNGTVVDDNRAPFGDPAAALIRSQIEQFQGQMQNYGVPAGSRLALRLFSA